MKKLDILEASVSELLKDLIIGVYKFKDQELTIEVAPENLIKLMNELKINAKFSFEQCQDVCGVDYLTYKDEEDKPAEAKRFASVYHLLSVKHNWRIRVKCFATSNDFPIIPSVLDIWSSVNWFEREAFDMYSIVFDGHPDLRRILTD